MYARKAVYTNQDAVQFLQNRRKVRQYGQN